jgi:hypothetical protein
VRSLLCKALLTVAAFVSVQAQNLNIGDARTVAEEPAIGNAHGAYGEDVYLVVWQDGSAGLSGTANIKGLRLRPGTLEPLDLEPIPICEAVEAQTSPVVAYAGGAFLVVWQDFRNGKDSDLRAALIGARTGGPQSIPVVVRPGNQIQPAVASGGDKFLVVWQEPDANGVYGISGVRISSSGKLLDKVPHRVAEEGSVPAASCSAGRFLVTWAGHRSSTSAAFVDPATGDVMKRLGTINSPCAEATAIAHDGAGNFMTVSAREGYPNPWGWPGPGAVLCSRVLATGATPESQLKYGPRLSYLCSRSVPNVIDAATWGKTSKTWDAGVPGGFPGTADGLWPNGWPAVAFDGHETYLFAWVKGAISKDRLNLSAFSVWVRGLNARTLAESVHDRKVSGAGADETHPVLVSGPRGEILLLSERLKHGEKRQVLARRIAVAYSK